MLDFSKTTCFRQFQVNRKGVDCHNDVMKSFRVSSAVYRHLFTCHFITRQLISDI